jgi:chromosome partitioning protein
MRVLVLASQKGGAGKTTLSRHLAVEAERAGAGPVVLLDADPQGGLAAWWNRRRADTPVFFSSTLAELPRRIEQARAGGFALAVIDTPPQVTSLIRAVVQLADLVLIPTRPSPAPSTSSRRPDGRWCSSSTAPPATPASPGRRRSRCRKAAPWRSR